MLKDLLTRAGNGLWQIYCINCDQRCLENPVNLLQFIRTLNPEALNLIVEAPSRQHRANQPRKHDAPAASTTQDSMVSYHMVQAKKMEKRAIMADTLVESNRIAYEAGRAGGVNGTAWRFCIEAGITAEKIQKRHDDHLCYYSGEHVRSGGNVVHTYWHCAENGGYKDQYYDTDRGGAGTKTSTPPSKSRIAHPSPLLGSMC